MTTAEKATEIELATKLFRGFADRTRLAILLELVPGELRVVVGATYPLADAAQAQVDLAERRTTGKLLLDVRA